MMDKRMHQSRDYKFIPMTSLRDRLGEEVMNDIFYYTDQIANVIFIGSPNDNDWVLVDAGLPYGSKGILKIAEKRFGKGSKPKAIILTHGHFDHVGGLIELVKEWQVPVYAHELEFPYLKGERSYPEPDGSVEGGFLAKISPMYPNEPINLGNAVHALPINHEVPYLNEWRWIHTPGHSPGHISLFRERDGVLIVGDAFITVRQDSFYNVLLQKPEVNGPPRYLTTEWETARASVDALSKLPINIVIPGHGPVMEGEELTEGLSKLVQNFDRLAIPDYGQYVDNENNFH